MRAAGLFLLAFAAMSGLPGRAAVVEPFVFYGNAHLPPMLNAENDRPEGIVVDIFDEISRRTADEITLELLDWGVAQARVRNGDGAGLVQLNKNPAREEYLLFSEPLLTSEFVIFHRRTDVHYQNLEALAGLTVGVEGGGFPKSLIKDRPEINRRILASWEEGFRLLNMGEIDAVIVDRWVGEYVLAQSGITGIVHSVVPLATLVSHIAVTKDRPELLRQIDGALNAMRADGTFGRILAQWRNSEVIYITERQNFLNQLVYGLVAGGSLLTLFLIVVVYRLRRTRRQLSDERALLEARVEERTEELKRRADSEASLRLKAQEAEQKALELAQAKTNLLATMSHELRTPLNAVIGYSEVLENGEKLNLKSDIVQRYSQIIGSSGRDLLNLINDILDYAKIGDERFELHDAPFNLSVEASNVRSAFMLRATEAGVTLTTDFPAETLTLYGDAMRFRQVIHNLVENAIKFSKGGHVHVEVCHERMPQKNCRVTVRVTDDGIGIDADRQTEIFDPFTQQDGSITRHYGGTGLGLSISRSLAEIMGGELTVESTPGEGSTFTASFLFDDISKLNSAFMEHQRGPDYKEPPNLDLNVLAVDDVRGNLDILGVLMKQLGCRLHAFTDARAAVAWSQNNRTDLVMMDIHMPEMDGYEVASRIKAGAGGYDKTPFFAWTADVGVVRRSEEASVEWDGVILKPTSREDLVVNLSGVASA